MAASAQQKTGQIEKGDLVVWMERRNTQRGGLVRRSGIVFEVGSTTATVSAGDVGAPVLREVDLLRLTKVGRVDVAPEVL